VNVGLQYTFQADWGGHARILAGQSFRISDENPFANPGQYPVTNARYQVTDTKNYFPQDSGLETAKSDYVLGMYLSPSTQFRMIGQARFDENDFDLQQANIFAEAYVGPFTASVSYSFLTNALARDIGVLDNLNTPDDETKDQQDILGRLSMRIDDNWSVSGGVRYDIDRAFLLQNIVQIQYSDECFVLSVSYRGSYIEDKDNDITQSDTIMLRFDLKHLGQFQTSSNLSALFDSDNEE
jgi:LPS-assembly protein